LKRSAAGDTREFTMKVFRVEVLIAGNKSDTSGDI
jgi:hypothetical protein